MTRILILFVGLLWAQFAYTQESVDTVYLDQSGNIVEKGQDFLIYEIRALNSRGKLDGFTTRHTKAGRHIETFEYKKGLKNGVYYRFNIRNDVMIYGEYDKNQKSGTWLTYGPEGALIQIDDYIKGAKVHSRNVDIGGTETNSDEYVVVEENCSFPGGNVAWANYLKDNLKYPLMAKRMGIQGRVYLKFAVLKDGKVAGTRIVQSPHPELSREAIRIMRECPNWNPAKVNGKPVDSEFKFFISFKLKN